VCQPIQPFTAERSAGQALRLRNRVPAGQNPARTGPPRAQFMAALPPSGPTPIGTKQLSPQKPHSTLSSKGLTSSDRPHFPVLRIPGSPISAPVAITDGNHHQDFLISVSKPKPPLGSRVALKETLGEIRY
jgi:hypothetical protein